MAHLNSTPQLAFDFEAPTPTPASTLTPTPTPLPKSPAAPAPAAALRSSSPEAPVPATAGLSGEPGQAPPGPSSGATSPSAQVARAAAVVSAPAAHSACLLRARTDAEAVEAWIGAKCDDVGGDRLGRPAHTARAYRREAQRFMLWLREERGANLAETTLEDCLSYKNFLADPTPRERWCAPRGTRVATVQWRPFEGPLSAGAIRQAIVILSGLYRFLQDQRYLWGNPWSGVSMPRNSTPKVDAGRRLTHAQWVAVEEQLALEVHDACARQRAWAVRLLYVTGLRLAEVTAARCGDFEWVDLDDAACATTADSGQPSAGAWVLSVLGKGMRVREVPVPADLVNQLGAMLAEAGGSEDPREHPGRPLLVASEGRLDGATELKRLSGPALYRQLKRLFARVARRLVGQGRRRDAEALLRASTHWLRHTFGAHSVAAGVALDVVQRSLGHSSLSTTTIYTNPELRRRVQESARLSTMASEVRCAIQARKGISPASG